MHSDYIMLIYFLLQQWSSESCSLLRHTTIACNFCLLCWWRPLRQTDHLCRRVLTGMCVWLCVNYRLRQWGDLASVRFLRHRKSDVINMCENNYVSGKQRLRRDIPAVLIKSQVSRSTVKHDLYLLRVFYKSVNNYMFRPLYWPSSGCTLNCNKANHTITMWLYIVRLAL